MQSSLLQTPRGFLFRHGVVWLPPGLPGQANSLVANGLMFQWQILSKVASGAKAIKREGGHPQAKVTGTSEPEPPVLKDGRGPQLEAKMSKLGHWASLGRPACGLGGQVRTGAATEKREPQVGKTGQPSRCLIYSLALET